MGDVVAVGVPAVAPDSATDGEVTSLEPVVMVALPFSPQAASAMAATMVRVAAVWATLWQARSVMRSLSEMDALELDFWKA